MEIYNYNIGELNVNQLLTEIKSQLNKKLVANYEGELIDGYFTSYDGNVTLGFNVDLTLEERALLDTLIINYTYNSNYEISKCFKINNSQNSPYRIDYDILGFNKKRIVIKGELKQVEYYKEYSMSSNTYSDLVVLETRDYIRDSIGIVQYRNQQSTWYLNDGTSGLTLNFTKYYSPEEAIQEGIDRRNNLISLAKTTLLSELKLIFGEPTNQLYGFDFLLGVSTQMSYFKDGYMKPLKDAVSGSTKPYMTQTIKDKIINDLTI